MTNALYLTDSYLKEFDAKVLSVKDNKFVVLNQTVFYPQGGGQPCDTGKLIRKSDNKEFSVVFVGKFGGDISHEVGEEGLQEGDEVHGVIDWDRRYRIMRMHTTAHLLSTIFHKQTGALITGNQLGEEKSRIDFNLEEFDREKIESYVKRANEIAAYGVDVDNYMMPREEAMKKEGMVKLAGALPPEVKELRIVKIGDVDEQADAGTHVKNTKEIGTISIISLGNKGKNNRRLYFTVA